MATAAKQRRGTPKPAGGRNGSRSSAAAEFAPGSLEVNFRLSESRRRHVSGRKSRPIISPISITTATAPRKRSEAGLRGHALLGPDISSARSVPQTADSCPAGAWGGAIGYDGRGPGGASGWLGTSRPVLAGGSFSGNSENPGRRTRYGLSPIAWIVSIGAAIV